MNINISDFLTETVIPADIRVLIPAKYTRVWKTVRRTDCRILWDTKANDLVFFGSKTDFTDDEWLALFTLGSRLKAEARKK